jgi:N-acetylglucosaminyldiphosphoundecaprenol N-acetyl-beta-D-mannosaminyltransferase
VGVSIFGVAPAALTAESALDEIFALFGSETRIVHFVHPHALNLAAALPSLHDCFRRCSLILPDGIGLRIGTRLLGGALPANLNGTDLLPLICKRAACEGRPLILIGSKPGVADKCASRLRDRNPCLEIPIVSDGYVDHSASQQLARACAKYPGALVLVGMGTPLQERWAHDYLAPKENLTILTVGGLFDFYSGDMPRAPMALREVGLEWLFRLWREPRRMARRYLLGNPLFLTLVLAQKLGINPRWLARKMLVPRLLGVSSRGMSKHSALLSSRNETNAPISTSIDVATPAAHSLHK